VSDQLHDPAALSSGKEPPGTLWVVGWVGPRTGLDGVEGREILPPPGLKLRPLDRPARSQSL
jgi:hypothetical protein